jgi:hypothetical protein
MEPIIDIHAHLGDICYPGGNEGSHSGSRCGKGVVRFRLALGKQETGTKNSE